MEIVGILLILIAFLYKSIPKDSPKPSEFDTPEEIWDETYDDSDDADEGDGDDN